MSPSSPAPDRKNPETLAKHAIKLLERALRDEYGIEVQAGVELEYSIRIPETLRLESGDKNDPIQGKKANSYTPASARQRPTRPFKRYIDKIPDPPKPGNYTLLPSGKIIFTDKVKEPLFPSSPWVSHSYRETGSNSSGWLTYETVLSHRPDSLRQINEPHDTPNVPFGEGRLLQLAHATQALRRTIAHTPPERHQFRNPKSSLKDDHWQNTWLNRLAHNIPDQDRITDAMGTRSMTHGLHLNLSVWHGGEDIGDNFSFGLAKNHHGYPKGVSLMDSRSALQHASCDIWNEGEYLVQPTDAAFTRAFSRDEHHGRYGIMLDKTRLEVMRPASSANPYYMVMLGLLGVYHAAQKYGFDKTAGHFDPTLVQGEYKDYEPFKKPPQTIRLKADEQKQELQALKVELKDRFFTSSSQIETLLNQLEPDLGTKFRAAIRLTPPGKEKTPEQAGVRSF